MKTGWLSRTDAWVAHRLPTAPAPLGTCLAVFLATALGVVVPASRGAAQSSPPTSRADGALLGVIQKGFQVTGSITPRLYQLHGVADRREWQIRLKVTNTTGYDIEWGQDLILVESDATADTFAGVYHSRSRVPLDVPKGTTGEHPWASRYGLNNFDLQWADGSQKGYCEGGTVSFRDATGDSRQTRADMLTFGVLAAGSARALDLELYQGRWLKLEHAASLRLALPELSVKAASKGGRFRVVAYFAKPAGDQQAWALSRLEVVPIEVSALLRTLATPEENVVTRIFAGNWAVAADPVQGAAGVGRVAASLGSGDLLAACLHLLLGVDGLSDPSLASHVRSLVAEPGTPEGIRQLGARYLAHVKVQAPTQVATSAPLVHPTPPAGDDPGAATKRQLQEMYLSFLRAEGFSPAIDKDGDIQFKREGNSYYILVGENDTGFFRIILPGLWSATNEAERVKLLAATERVSRETKVVKAYIVNDQAIVAFEQFVLNPEDFRGTFTRAMAGLDSARAKVLEDMRRPSD